MKAYKLETPEIEVSNITPLAGDTTVNLSGSLNLTGDNAQFYLNGKPLDASEIPNKLDKTGGIITGSLEIQSTEGTQLLYTGKGEENTVDYYYVSIPDRLKVSGRTLEVKSGNVSVVGDLIVYESGTTRKTNVIDELDKKATVTEVTQLKTDLEDSINDVSDKADQNKKDIDDINLTLATLPTKTDLDNKISKVGNNTMTGNLAINGKLTVANGISSNNIASNNISIGSIDTPGKLYVNGEDISDIKNIVNTNSQAINNINTTIFDYNNLKTSVNTNTSNITSLQNNKADKTELESKLDKTGGTITGSLVIEKNKSPEKIILTDGVINASAGLIVADNDILSLIGTKADKTELESKLDKTGGTITGNLNINEKLTVADIDVNSININGKDLKNEIASKADKTELESKLDKTGGTITGNLIVDGDITSDYLNVQKLKVKGIDITNINSTVTDNTNDISDLQEDIDDIKTELASKIGKNDKGLIVDKLSLNNDLTVKGSTNFNGDNTFGNTASTATTTFNTVIDAKKEINAVTITSGNINAATAVVTQSLTVHNSTILDSLTVNGNTELKGNTTTNDVTSKNITAKTIKLTSGKDEIPLTINDVNIVEEISKNNSDISSIRNSLNEHTTSVSGENRLHLTDDDKSKIANFGAISEKCITTDGGTITGDLTIKNSCLNLSDTNLKTNKNVYITDAADIVAKDSAIFTHDLKATGTLIIKDKDVYDHIMNKKIHNDGKPANFVWRSGDTMVGDLIMSTTCGRDKWADIKVAGKSVGEHLLNDSIHVLTFDAPSNHYIINNSRFEEGHMVIDVTIRDDLWVSKWGDEMRDHLTWDQEWNIPEEERTNRSIADIRFYEHEEGKSPTHFPSYIGSSLKDEKSVWSLDMYSEKLRIEYPYSETEVINYDYRDYSILQPGKLFIGDVSTSDYEVADNPAHGKTYVSISKELDNYLLQCSGSVLTGVIEPFVRDSNDPSSRIVLVSNWLRDGTATDERKTDTIHLVVSASEMKDTDDGIIKMSSKKDKTGPHAFGEITINGAPVYTHITDNTSHLNDIDKHDLYDDDGDSIKVDERPEFVVNTAIDKIHANSLQHNYIDYITTTAINTEQPGQQGEDIECWLHVYQDINGEIVYIGTSSTSSVYSPGREPIDKQHKFCFENLKIDKTKDTIVALTWERKGRNYNELINLYESNEKLYFNTIMTSFNSSVGVVWYSQILYQYGFSILSEIRTYDNKTMPREHIENDEIHLYGLEKQKIYTADDRIISGVSRSGYSFAFATKAPANTFKNNYIDFVSTEPVMNNGAYAGGNTLECWMHIYQDSGENGEIVYIGSSKNTSKYYWANEVQNNIKHEFYFKNLKIDKTKNTYFVVNWEKTGRKFEELNGMYSTNRGTMCFYRRNNASNWSIYTTEQKKYTPVNIVDNFTLLKEVHTISSLDDVVMPRDHMDNDNIHVTQEQKQTWTNHVENDNIHVTTEEKQTWVNHVENDNIHVTTEEKEAIASTSKHINNKSIHIESSQKDALNEKDSEKSYTNEAQDVNQFNNNIPAAAIDRAFIGNDSVINSLTLKPAIGSALPETEKELAIYACSSDTLPSRIANTSGTKLFSPETCRFIATSYDSNIISADDREYSWHFNNVTLKSDDKFIFFTLVDKGTELKVDDFKYTNNFKLLTVNRMSNEKSVVYGPLFGPNNYAPWYKIETSEYLIKDIKNIHRVTREWSGEAFRKPLYTNEYPESRYRVLSLETQGTNEAGEKVLEDAALWNGYPFCGLDYSQIKKGVPIKNISIYLNNPNPLQSDKELYMVVYHGTSSGPTVCLGKSINKIIYKYSKKSEVNAPVKYTWHFAQPFEPFKGRSAQFLFIAFTNKDTTTDIIDQPVQTSDLLSNISLKGYLKRPSWDGYSFISGGNRPFVLGAEFDYLLPEEGKLSDIVLSGSQDGSTYLLSDGNIPVDLNFKDFQWSLPQNAGITQLRLENLVNKINQFFSDGSNIDILNLNDTYKFSITVHKNGNDIKTITASASSTNGLYTINYIPTADDTFILNFIIKSGIKKSSKPYIFISSEGSFVNEEPEIIPCTRDITLGNNKIYSVTNNIGLDITPAEITNKLIKTTVIFTPTVDMPISSLFDTTDIIDKVVCYENTLLQDKVSIIEITQANMANTNYITAVVTPNIK